MSCKPAPNPGLTTVSFEGVGAAAYAAIVAEHGPKLSALADRVSRPVEAGKLRELAEMLSNLAHENRYLWLCLLLERASALRTSAGTLARATRDEMEALVKDLDAVYAADRRAAVESVQVTRALQVLSVRRPDAYAAVAAVLSGTGIDPASEDC